MKIAVVGGSGGIGLALVRHLAASSPVETVYATYHRQQPEPTAPNVNWLKVDLTDESSIADWSQTVGQLDWLVNAAGILHTARSRPEKSVAEVHPEFFMQNVAVNALPTLLLAKHLRNQFNHRRSAVFSVISARVGSIADNRLGGWYSYRASKAALNMGVKTLALEWKRTHPNVAVVALHPGTTDTPLSAPFQRHVPTEKLFSRAHAAACLIGVLRNLSPKDSGSFLSYSGEQLPW